MKDGLKFIVLGFVALVVILGLVFGLGKFGNFYESTIGKENIDIKRENFEHSKSYIHSKLEDLSTYKREYLRAKTDEEKEQIRNFVLDEFATFDTRYIDNPDLYNFLLEMQN